MTDPTAPDQQSPAAIDRRRLMGLTAVAGLGITTLSLRPAAAAASFDGEGEEGGGGAQGTLVDGVYFSACTTTSTAFTVRMGTASMLDADLNPSSTDIRIRFTPDPAGGAQPSAWFATTYLAYASGGTFEFFEYSSNLALVTAESPIVYSTLGNGFMNGDYRVDVALFSGGTLDEQFATELQAADNC